LTFFYRRGIYKFTAQKALFKKQTGGRYFQMKKTPGRLMQNAVCSVFFIQFFRVRD